MLNYWNYLKRRIINFFFRWITTSRKNFIFRIMHNFHPPRMKEKAVMDEDEEGRGEGKRERRSLALSTGPAYWRALRGDHTPLLDRGCLCFAILAVRQPAPASKTRGDRRGEEGRKLWKFRTRIVRESESWKLCDPFIVEMSRNSIKIEKMEGRVFFSFFVFWSLVWRKKE